MKKNRRTFSGRLLFANALTTSEVLVDVESMVWIMKAGREQEKEILRESAEE